MDSKTEPIQVQWIEWLQQSIRVVRDDGFFAMPLRGLIYQLDKVAQVATLVAVYKPALNNDVQIMTDRIFNHLGWKVVVAEGIVKETAQEFVAFFESVHPGDSLVSKTLLEKLEAFSHRN